VLETFLDYFVGCLVVVSHDRYFLDRTVDFLVTLEHGQLGPRYPTPYSTYERLRQEVAAKTVTAKTVTAKTVTAKTVAEKASVAPIQAQQKSVAPVRKLSWKEQRELTNVEARVAALETSKTNLLVEMNAVGADYVKLQRLTGQLATLETELESTLERWLELSEMAA